MKARFFATAMCMWVCLGFVWADVMVSVPSAVPVSTPAVGKALPNGEVLPPGAVSATVLPNGEVLPPGAVPVQSSSTVLSNGEVLPPGAVPLASAAPATVPAATNGTTMPGTGDALPPGAVLLSSSDLKAMDKPLLESKKPIVANPEIPSDDVLNHVDSSEVSPPAASDLDLSEPTKTIDKIPNSTDAPNAPDAEKGGDLTDLAPPTRVIIPHSRDEMEDAYPAPIPLQEEVLSADLLNTDGAAVQSSLVVPDDDELPKPPPPAPKKKAQKKGMFSKKSKKKKAAPAPAPAPAAVSDSDSTDDGSADSGSDASSKTDSKTAKGKKGKSADDGDTDKDSDSDTPAPAPKKKAKSKNPLKKLMKKK